MKFSAGSLVNARGRDWIVMPESEDTLLILKPLGGSDDEITGILSDLETVAPASFELPSADDIGDNRSCSLLRDALRLGFRSGAGPFRSFGKIAVEPRPYQLVPLMMALRQDPVRIMISDDVGIGKTIESCLIARELIDRAECRRTCILCPPHLAEQWQQELKSKFHIDAELVLSGTIRSLEKRCRSDQSVFDVYPHTVVSIDYIKSDRRRDEFLRTAPEFVIIDEAHTASADDVRNSGRHQRHDLVKRLCENRERHIVLVTATPHSGKESAFRSLLGFLDPEFLKFPENLSGTQNEKFRREIAKHFIQRRRADIRHFLDEDTEFPECEAKEIHYSLTKEYLSLFEKALRYAREIVKDAEYGNNRQRVRWWSALALLRALASSPAAAAATLRSRSATADLENASEINEIGRRIVMDADDMDSADASDIVPGADISENDESGGSDRSRLLSMAREADRLCGDSDSKMTDMVKQIKSLIKDGFRPIVFCRFIQTAEYLAEELKKRLPSKVGITAVTGLLPHDERERRVIDLAESEQRVLVCTDCLSEGVNLQDHFDAVIHYDLSWNPTRHEQREGRVDRFGQPKPKVRMITYYGVDNQIDGIVLDVLLRKHRQIKTSLGISVPVPGDTEKVVEAIFEGLLLRENSGTSSQLLLPGFDDLMKKDMKSFHAEWDNVTEKEKRSRTMFAQDALSARIDEIRNELSSARKALGSPEQVEKFVIHALEASGAKIAKKGQVCNMDLRAVPAAIRDACGIEGRKLDSVTARFSLPADEKDLYLCRTHPFVEGLSNHILNTALDRNAKDSLARRCGVIRTDSVQKRTTLILLRLRFHLTVNQDTGTTLLAEEAVMAGFTGSPERAEWIGEDAVSALLDAKSTGNVLPEQSERDIARIKESFHLIRPALEDLACEKAKELQESHTRVREAALSGKNRKVEIRPELPPDVLGIYVYLPS